MFNVALVPVVAWCHQDTSHYQIQCWTRSMSPYGVSRPQRGNINFESVCECKNIQSRGLKVAEDDIAFKLAILKKSLHLNDNTCFCSIQSSKLVLGSLLPKNNFFVQFWTKNFASSRMANCGSGLPAEWPFRSQKQLKRRIRHCPVACG